MPGGAKSRCTTGHGRIRKVTATVSAPRRATAAHRRHHELVAAAGARVDFRAIAELQVLADADAHFVEPPAVACHRNRFRVRPGLAFTKASSTSSGVTVSGARVEIGVGNFHRPRAPCARSRNRRARRQPRAGAVAVPFVKDQPRRRHQVEHRRHDVAVEPRRRHLAIFRKAALVLRPQPVHDEGIGPAAALLLRRRSGARSPRRLAVRRRPGQRQHVEVELAGLVLATVLRRSAGTQASITAVATRRRAAKSRTSTPRQLKRRNDHRGPETIPQQMRTFKNKLSESPGGKSAAGSGPRHLAGRVVGPVAVEPDHAPFDAPGRADHAGVLADGVVHHRACGRRRCRRWRCRSGAGWHWRPTAGTRSHGCLSNATIRRSEFQKRSSLVAKREAIRGAPRGVARRQHAVIARAGQPEILLEPIGGASAANCSALSNTASATPKPPTRQHDETPVDAEPSRWRAAAGGQGRDGRARS